MNGVNKTFTQKDNAACPIDLACLNKALRNTSVFRRNYFSRVVAAAFCMGAGQVFACVPTTVVPEVEFLVTSIDIVQPVPVGGQIGWQGFVASNPFTFTCVHSTWSWQVSLWARSVKSPVINWVGYNVYPTGVAGVGYVIDVGHDHNSLSGLVAGPTGPGQRLWVGWTIDYIATRAGIRFIATAPLQPGTLRIPRQVIATLGGRAFNATSINNPGGSANLVLPALTVNVNTQTCDLAAGDTNRTIKLNTVRRDDFTGTSAGKQNFEITANCSGASRVTFRFTGTPATNDPLRFSNTGTAKSIGLWLYSRINGTDQTIAANNSNDTRTVTVTNGRAVLPLGAAYYNASGGPVPIGTLASNVTVNISYN